jgi:hypothetical protein
MFMSYFCKYEPYYVRRSFADYISNSNKVSWNMRQIRHVCLTCNLNRMLEAFWALARGESVSFSDSDLEVYTLLGLYAALVVRCVQTQKIKRCQKATKKRR